MSLLQLIAFLVFLIVVLVVFFFGRVKQYKLNFIITLVHVENT